MIFGFGAALLWGVADLGAALVGRRIGSFALAIWAQLAGLVVICGIAVVTRPAWSGGWIEVLALFANGCVVASAYVMHYRALELGPVALVAPVTAAYGVVPIALAVGVLGERLSGGVLVGAALAIVGVILTSTDPRQFGSATKAPRAGLPLALISMLLFGLATFVLGWASRRIGWLPTVGLGRAFSMLALSTVLLTRRRGSARARGSGVWAALLVGAFDILGIAAFAHGTQVASLSLVTAISATFPVIPFIGGVALLRERPAPSQALGVVLVIGGLVVLGFA